MAFIVQRIVPLLLLCCESLGFDFAKPLEMPELQSVYEYDLTVQWKLSMAHYNADNKAEVLQWDAEKAEFQVRHPGADTACFHTTPVQAGKVFFDQFLAK